MNVFVVMQLHLRLDCTAHLSAVIRTAEAHGVFGHSMLQLPVPATRLQ